MSVVLTIEPDSSQAEASRGILASREGVELVLVTSTGAAIEAIDRQVPDLILVSALLSPRDEAEIVAHLRSIDDAGHLQTLTIPQLRRAEESSRASSFFGRKKKKPAAAPAGCDPAVFAEEVATYLARGREVRNQASVARRDLTVTAAELPSLRTGPASDPVAAPIVEKADAFMWKTDEPPALDEHVDQAGGLETEPVQQMEPPAVEPGLAAGDGA